MSQTKSNYLVLANDFDQTLSNIAKKMDASGLEWFVIAGWALDLFAGKKTRPHKDIEISIWRDEAPQLFKSFPNNKVDMIVGHKRYQTLQNDSVLDQRGHLVIRNIVEDRKSFDIELFTTERNNSSWIFRKQNEVMAPFNEAILTATCGTPYLAPQFVLLYKAWFFPVMEKTIMEQPSEADFIRKCWETDCQDFHYILPLMSSQQKMQLHQMLVKYTSEIPWLKDF